jgi:16S rRNA (guanine966-N2)-methyltransferase
MRIIGGEFRGRRLKAPKGRNTRPTPDRVREALFSILGPAIEGARVLELFGGTGSLGLESLSRGAAQAVFCEVNRAALACLNDNIATLGVGERTRVHRVSALDFPRRAEPGEPFDFVFCDPPHRLLSEARSRRQVEKLLGEISLAPDGQAILEHRTGALSDFSPPILTRRDLRIWGSTGMAFYQSQINADSA